MMIDNSITDKRYVYILLSRTSTVPSKLIRAYTKEPFAHTSLALDMNLYEMYSFARKRVNNPIDCGFISEDINTGIFGRDRDTTCRVFAVPVTVEQYDRVVEEINIFKANKQKYSYNYRGIFGVMINKPVVREYKYFCSEFVARVLDNAGVKVFEKNPSLASPSDFKIALADRMIYDGLLTEYRNCIKDYTADDIEGKLIEKIDEAV